MQGNQEVLRIHQPGHHRMRAAEHLLHVEFAAGEVGDRIQRALQPRGLAHASGGVMCRHEFDLGAHARGEQGKKIEESRGSATCPGARLGPFRDKHGPRIVQCVGNPHPAIANDATRDARVTLLGRFDQQRLFMRQRCRGPLMPTQLPLLGRAGNPHQARVAAAEHGFGQPQHDRVDFSRPRRRLGDRYPLQYARGSGRGISVPTRHLE